MLAILWLIVWATVGDAFYDDYNWYTSDDGVSDGAFDSQKVIRENFSHILRSFADSYIPTRGGDNELTLAKAKSKLRMMKVFTHTGNSKDFEPNKGQMLPLHDGAKFCTMGRHTKVACNQCTCVAGQLYMCTGMICPKAPAKPRPVITCKEGKRRKIDSCNYCYCRNGHEICSTKDCRLRHERLLVRSQYTCREGARRKISCNRCICRYGEEYCTKNKCTKQKPTQLKLKQDNQMPEGRCNDGRTLKIDCRVCKCTHNRWHCSDKNCGVKNKPEKLLWAKCKEGTTRQLDACNTCYCRLGREFCEKKVCDEEEHLQYYRNLRYYDGSQCDEGRYRKVDSCNYCLCLNGTELCTNRPCQENNLDFLRRRQDCDRWDVKYERCNHCECLAREWVCTKKLCEGDAGQKSETGGEEGLKNDDNFEEQPCEQGSRKKINCNRCYCFKGIWLCQNKDCGPDMAALPPNCKKHDKIIVDCIPCKCRRRGWKCYIRKKKRNCKPGKKAPVPATYLRMTYGHDGDEDLPKKCNIGERYRIDSCNYCYCNEYRERVCSNNKCNDPQLFKGDDRFPMNISEQRCKIGSTFRKDECNYCYCNSERQLVCSQNHCTRKLNTGPSDEKEVLQFKFTHNFLPSKTKLCTDGIRRQVDACNYCVCHTGIEFCTQKSCWRDTVPTLYSEPTCLMGDPVPAPDPCNLCICLDSDILCTNNPCIQSQSIEYKQSGCVEGNKYRMDDGCNFCLCQGGQEFCTSRACLVQGDPGLVSAGCNEGEVTAAEDRCNMCVCMRGKIICTNKDCSRRKLGDAISESLLSYIRTQKTNKHKMTQGTKRRCNPGQNYFPDDFDPNCPNDCICDRHELLCTKRKCFNNWDKQTPFKWPLGRVNKKTRHAKLYLKQDCDEYQKMQSGDRCTSCMCLNGRKVCTIVNCSDDNDGEPSYIETLINNNPRGSKGKNRSTNNTFCEPFTFFSPDSNRFCRNCFCLHNGLALCLLNLCKYSMDIPHHSSPEELDEVCTPGETGYPTKCVTCTCSEQGKWICTREELALCQERNCDQKDEFHMGFFPYCAGCKCAVKEWFCSIQSESCSDFSNVTCPLGTFIRNPIQHCSICLCGGYEEGSHNMCFTEAKCVRQVISQLIL